MHPPPPHPWWMLPYRGGEDLPSCPGIRLRRCRRGETWLLKEGKKKRDFERSVDTLQASPTLEVTPARLPSTTSQLWAAVSPATPWCCSTSDDVWSQHHGYDAATLLRPLQALTPAREGIGDDVIRGRCWCHTDCWKPQSVSPSVSSCCEVQNDGLLSSGFCYSYFKVLSLCHVKVCDFICLLFFFLVETLHWCKSPNEMAPNTLSVNMWIS